MKKRNVFLGLAAIILLVGMTSCDVPPTPQFDVSISASPSTFSAAGQMITFAYTVQNPNTNMRVQIEDSGLGFPCEEFWLQPDYGGETQKTCSINYTTTQADVDAGTITTSAVFRASTEATGGCCQTPSNAEKTASVSVALVYDESTAPLNSAGWTIATAGCDPETDQMGFSVNTGYAWLTSSSQVSYTASDTETQYTCEVNNTPGMVNCRGSHSEAPGTLTFCLQRSTDASPICQQFTDFPGWIEGIACVPDWEITYAACDGTTQVYFVIDTHYAWLDNSGIYGYTATDGQTTYWCDTSQNPGLVYCYGTKTTVTEPLEFCFQRPEDTAPLCKTFDTFPARVNMLSCEPTPTVAPACSSIKSELACNNTPGCKWANGTMGPCVNNP